MAKRALPELGVKPAGGAAKEEPPEEKATQRLIRSNFLKDAPARSTRDSPAGAVSQNQLSESTAAR